MRPKIQGAVVHSYERGEDRVQGRTASHKDLCSTEQYSVRELFDQKPSAELSLLAKFRSDTLNLR
jgi:hypothetical protein